MKCDEFLEMMDAFVDGELGEDARQGILEHARVCENCAKELKLNELLRGALLGADANVVLPLSAQASWRAAVKAEARRRRVNGIYRTVGAVAAAFVVLIGVTAGLKFLNDKPAASPPQQNLEVQAADEFSTFAYVEPDGDETAGTTQPVAFSAKSDEGNASVKLIAADVGKAVDTIKSLVAEFNGYVGMSSVSETSAYITAYIPSGELTDFTDSLAYAGTVESSRVNDKGGDISSVTITIKSE